MTKQNFELDRKLNEISFFYLNEYEKIKNEHIGLYNGKTGVLLLQYSIYRYSEDVEIKEKINKNIELIINSIINSKHIFSELSYGLAGIAFVFNLINKDHDFSSGDLEDFLKEADEILEQELNELIKVGNYDLLHGAFGVGIYLLSRRKTDSISTLIDFLIRESKEDQNGVKWQRFDKNIAKDYIYDFGLAHGMSGILFFLGKCYQHNIRKEEIKYLLEKGVDFLVSNSDNSKKSCYPSRYISSKFDSGNFEYQFSRLAWCYGDLGVTHTLLLLSKWMNNSKIEEIAKEQLIMSSYRRTKEDTLIEDAGFCHGSSGASIIYKSAFYLTNEKIFLEASNFWLNETLKLGNEDAESICGYKFQLKHDLRDSDTSILNGLGGVLLSLLYHKDFNNNNWKNVFFLN